LLSKIFNCAISWGYFGGENAVRRVVRLQESPGRVRFLSADEAKLLLQCAGKQTHLKAVILCGLHTGGRRMELLSLRWEDIDFERGLLYFDQTNTKSGKQREVPISPNWPKV
jgi:integrase